jgi:hypothetical protein
VIFLIFIAIKGYILHQQAISYQLGADILFLLLEPNVGVELTISGKFFEYLYAQKYIIGIMPENSRVARELKKFKVGRVFPQNKPQELKKFLIDILVHRKDYLITIDEKSNEILFFEWENQFRILSHKLRELIE